MKKSKTNIYFFQVVRTFFNDFILIILCVELILQETTHECCLLF